MSNLKIIEVSIEDSLSQIAKTCTLVLAPESNVDPPVAEFGYPGDTLMTGGTDLRPNGAFIDVVGSYGGLPPHVLFSGSIEYMDDTEDPDLSTYRIILSQVPRGFPHRQKRSAVWNMTEHGEDIGWESVTAHSILESICAKAGIVLGRCDLPNYTIWGTYEVIQQSPIDVANALVQPFNQSDHEKYYVRMDMNGLQIIRVKYAAGADTTTGVAAYPLTRILKRHSGYQIYIPEKSTDGDILLTGGDKYGTNLQGMGVWQVTAVHTYIEDSRTSYYNLSSGEHIQAGDNWSEKLTEVLFNVELSYNAEDIAYDASISFPATPVDGEDIDTIVDQVKNGDFTSVSIIDSLAWHTWEKSYNLKGLYSMRETYVTYEKKSFRGEGSVDTSFMDTEKTVPVYDDTITYSIGGAGQIPTTSVRHWYKYDDLGNSIQTITATYNFYRYWQLQSIDIQTGETTGITNSQIQFYLNAWKNYNSPSGTQPLKNGTRISSNKTPLLRYQLLNGKKLLPLDVAKPRGNTSFVVNEEYWNSIVKNRNALQVSCPGMDYTGLGLVWTQISEGLQYQTGAHYWHIVGCSHVLDTSPVVGESIKIGGVTAICETLKHTINGDEAVTEATARRLAKR